VVHIYNESIYVVYTNLFAVVLYVGVNVAMLLSIHFPIFQIKFYMHHMFYFKK